ncbi:photosystem II reaction center protein [Salix suchowensis]|uniref:PSII 6.1 kDa protein n=1 Tax=Salix koriyanagi TaxID=2511006 RepID=A0A9Q0TCL6_9ROSI|nr:photosystem II reaction center protein [Salix suchowensis]KAJ6708945.1 PHOTOSYSTEM II REACTION CENTER W PROTEIN CHLOROPLASTIC [Salix koriyanagi]
MATITASAAKSSIVRAALARKPSVGLSSSSVLGLPAMAKKEKVSCSMEGKPTTVEGKSKGMSASLMAAVGAATISSPALALVDERMSTEGTGLPFGLSNNLLVWILLGVFSLIWSLYFVYTSSLDEDDDSGLSL